MGKSGRRRNRPSRAKPPIGKPSEDELEDPSASSNGFHWKKIDVAFAGEQRNEDDEGDSDLGANVSKKRSALEKNHYDNPTMQTLASKELEATSNEAGGIFFGLEVLDGNSYRIHEDPESNQRIMVPINKSSAKERDDGSPRIQSKPEKKSSGTSTSKDSGSTKQPAATKTKKKRKRAAERTQSEGDDDSSHPVGSSRKKSQKKKRSGPSKDEDIQRKDLKEMMDSDQILSMQTSWSSQTGGVNLHMKMCAALLRQQFWSPTPIQAAALPAAILGRRNIVGGAPTGSGKTLAFLLPIGQYILENQSVDSEAQKESGEDRSMQQPMQAMILTPTRELALQIQTESDKLLGKGASGALVGGLAHAKQRRILEKKRPPIVVATPGRLWEMMSSRDYSHLNDLSQIRFLVIDEADRMIKQGSFPQLSMILDAVQMENPEDDEDSNTDEDIVEDGEFDSDRLLGLPGVPGEAKLVMLNDNILEGIERQKDVEPDKPEDSNDGENAQQQSDKDNEQSECEDDSDESGEEISLPARPPVHRQTFVYSATLTLPASVNFTKSKQLRFTADANLDGAIAEILEKSRAKGKTKVIDLSNVTNKKATVKQPSSDRGKMAPTSEGETFRLPDGLSLLEIKCTQRHKDSHLYAYLMTTLQGSAGPCLVFCNSIACVRRVGATLQTLGVDARILHAQMQQRARFKAVELLHNPEKRTVVIATDVAARGLDIPSVASVVHYDAARSVDAFVHRSGRTARGVGPNAVGCSVSMVAPDEDKMHSSISKAINVKFEPMLIDGRLLHRAQERVNLASKVAEVGNLEKKSQRNNQWLKGKAADAGLDIDDDILDEGLSGGDSRDMAKLKEAQKAKERLKQLLGEPLKTQRYGKFLSTNTALKQDVMLQTPKSNLPNLPMKRSKKRRRRK